MAYNYSQIDKDNLGWFKQDDSRATLLEIKISNGQVRSLSKELEIFLRYPITVIAGRNGSGKSTVLALAACAYHNNQNGFKLKDRKKSYYTFSDFFIQTEDEIPLEGIEIEYCILNNHHNNHRVFAPLNNIRYRAKKKRGGRWNDYSKRANRTVVYLGISRIVPHSEKANSGTYLKSFKSIISRGKEDDVRAIVSRILDRNYTSLEFLESSRNNLATVEYENIYYSGFNMGAGEHSLFELISLLYIVEEGSLILVDEIELGLHEDAQSKLIAETKKICKSRKLQIICTSHSSEIIDSVPPEGRIFLEFKGEKTIVIPEVSSNYATGKLKGKQNKVLDILVEDEVAKLIIETAIDAELRKQINIISIGSHSAVMRHLAAKFIEKDFRDKDVCVILDGDRKSSEHQQIKHFKDSLEQKHNIKINLEEWCKNRLSYLPGNTHPENWVISQKTNPMYEVMEQSFSINKIAVDELFNQAKLAGKHNEFYKVSEELALDRSVVSFALIRGALRSCPDEKEQINNFVVSQIK